jgi:hypothetical protein
LKLFLSFLLFVVFTARINGQVRIDKSIRNHVNELIKSDSSLTAAIKKPAFAAHGTIMIFSQLNIDTLNKRDYFPFDSTSEVVYAEANRSESGFGKLVSANGNLTLSEAHPFSPRLKFRIGVNYVLGYLEKNEMLVGAVENISTVKKLDSKLHIYDAVLSQANFTKGQVLYGYIHFMSGIFRVKDADAKHGYMMAQVTGKFYFMGKIK